MTCHIDQALGWELGCTGEKAGGAAGLPLAFS